MSYKELGLKCGIEIHQQLEGRKLFCACPTLMREDQPQFTVRRKMRAAAGESGKIDVAAQEEQAKDKTFIYEGYHDTTCLVELDEEPPHEINPEALYTALQFSTIVNSTISSVVQVMRKTVVDGSNTSGFQRTALMARNGTISTSIGTVRLTNISLEEDAAKIISETAAQKTYRLDRLGIPLIEIGTAADITSPQQCREAAKKIGMLLRSLPGVKRGLGTIRQDVNVSITGGTRIEIKGAQDLQMLPVLVELEAKRQEELLKIKEELKGVTVGKKNIIDVSSLFHNTASKFIQKTLQQGGKVLGLRLEHLAGYLKRELMPKYRLGTEFSGRAKIIAGVGGIFHSDELPNYGITEPEITEVKRVLKCIKSDAFVLVTDTEERARKALEAVYERAGEVWKGVPPEVRKAHPDGTTSYMRPMPGAARMYPETDVPLIVPDTSAIELPELLEQKMARFQQEFGLGKDLAEFIAKSDQVSLFEELIQKYPDIKPAFIAETLTSTVLDIKRQYELDPELLTEAHFRELFKYLHENKIHKDIVLDVLIDMIKGTFDVKRYAALGTEEIHAVLQGIIKKNATAPFPALMGLAMKQLQGKASGKFIAEQLKKMVEGKH